MNSLTIRHHLLLKIHSFTLVKSNLGRIRPLIPRGDVLVMSLLIPHSQVSMGTRFFSLSQHERPRKPSESAAYFDKVVVTKNNKK